MEPWIDQLAAALGEERLSKEEVGRLLGIARDVAHRVERKITPLATFLLGEAVGRGVGRGTDRADALRTALETTAALLPEPAPDEPAQG